ncbi:hypothetical protein BC936DRAFT_140598 [Jimgerdemannia flammicorona]|uniref:Major facilitator superfamily domain-containing protein n=1 Tax=Jimgerdemannia flammicorona TaxID=994334 RepID=A0A433AKH1_9FUNG|nr:hypothetical protein BC936DRAFT_140598 [Jimgerdemannia flammicorona]
MVPQTSAGDAPSENNTNLPEVDLGTLYYRPLFKYCWPTLALHGVSESWICLGETAFIKSHPDAKVVEIYQFVKTSWIPVQISLFDINRNCRGSHINVLTNRIWEEICLPPSAGAFFTGNLSGINAAGRILWGQAADMLGPINVMIALVFASGLPCLAIWMFVAYGLTGGAFWALIPLVAAQVVVQFKVQEQKLKRNIIF